MAKRRHRRHQARRETQARQWKRIEAQLAALGGAALSQPIFLVASGGRATVSRAMPGVLEGHMDDPSWTAFCGKIDEALLTLGKIRRDMKLRCLLPLAIFLPLVLFGLLATALVPSLPDALPVMLFSIAFVGSMAWALGAARRSSRRRASVNEILVRTCYETSTSHPGVSFKVYVDLRYIQVIVASGAEDVPSELTLDADEENSKSSKCDSTASSSTASSDTASSDAPPAVAPAATTKWRYAVDEESGKTYFFHQETQEVSWELPLDALEADGVRPGGGEGKVADELEVDA